MRRRCQAREPMQVVHRFGCYHVTWLAEYNTRSEAARAPAAVGSRLRHLTYEYNCHIWPLSGTQSLDYMTLLACSATVYTQVPVGPLKRDSELGLYGALGLLRHPLLRGVHAQQPRLQAPQANLLAAPAAGQTRWPSDVSRSLITGWMRKPGRVCRGRYQACSFGVFGSGCSCCAGQQSHAT